MVSVGFPPPSAERSNVGVNYDVTPSIKGDARSNSGHFSLVSTDASIVETVDAVQQVEVLSRTLRPLLL